MPALKIEREAALGKAPEIERIIFFEDVEERSELAGRNVLDEEFEGTLIRRRDDGVGALDAFAVAIKTKGGVLTGLIVIRAARIDFEDKKIFGNLPAFHNACRQKLFRWCIQESPLTKRMANRWKVAGRTLRRSTWEQERF